MGNTTTKHHKIQNMDPAAALEEQWMDPHKRKVLAAVEDTIEKCRDAQHEPRASALIKSIRQLCSVIYNSNDFELIQQCQDTFPGLVQVLQNPSTSFSLRQEIVSAISILCQGNQVNCRSWCDEGGMTVLLSQFREVSSENAQPLDSEQNLSLHMNIWVIYTMRTLMCSSPEAIQTVMGLEDFSRVAELLVKMYQMKDVWQKTAEQQNYALDCCILLGIGGTRKLKAVKQ